MVDVFRSSWALLLGMFLLMIGNGLQGSLLGVRGAIEGFDPAYLSFVISAYFVGFLGGSWLAPGMIRNVGHVRVFAAMASLISAMFILYAAVPNIWAWGLMRLVVGFCFSSVYVVAESWLNDASSNENRGKALSVYLIVQMLGIVTGQGVLNFGDPAGYGLFVLISVVVSVSFAPILLSVSPAPVYETAKRMTLRELFHVSPLGFVGAVLVGAVFSALFGMASVYGAARGLSIGEIATFVSAIFLGGMVLQWPIGWASDRMDRRLLIVLVTAFSACACLGGMGSGASANALYVAAFLIGGAVNPLYGVVIAHANDYLEHEDMASASAGLVFIVGLGAVGGPVIVGQMMQALGPWAFFLYIFGCMSAISLYGVYRMTRRAARPAEETYGFVAVSPASGPVSVDIAWDYASDQRASEQQSDEETPGARDSAAIA